MSVETILGTDDNDFIHIFQLGYDSLTEFYIEGGNGDDVLRVGHGSSTVIGGKGEDRILSGDGNDTISAGNHNDWVNAGRGDDHISGGAGNDILRAGKGDDVVLGGTGNDKIFGVKGYNTLDGGEGNDQIDTGVHTSTVMGGTGNDIIKAVLSKGADHTLSGGADADTFKFKSQTDTKSSHLTITDFELGIDKFIISGVQDDNFLIDFSTVTEVDGNAVLDMGMSDTLTFEGITAIELIDHYNDFFV